MILTEDKSFSQWYDYDRNFILNEILHRNYEKLYETDINFCIQIVICF